MNNIFEKLNKLQSLDEIIYDEFLYFLSESNLMLNHYIDQALQVTSPIGLLYIEKGFEYFLPSSKEDSEETNISKLIKVTPKNIRIKDIEIIKNLLKYVHKVRKTHNLSLNHGLIVASHNFAFNYSGIDVEVFIPWIIEYIKTENKIMHSPILSSYDIDEQEEIVLNLKAQENLPKTIVYIFKLLYFFMGKEQTHQVFSLIKSTYEGNLIDIEQFWLDETFLKKLSYSNPFKSFLTLCTFLKSEHKHTCSLHYLFA